MAALDEGQRGLRVTHVVCTDAFAGVERYVANLATGQAGQGLRVAVVGGSPPEMRAELEPAGVAWYAGATIATAARALIRLGPLEVVHVHMTAAEAAGWLTRPWHRGRLVATRHFPLPRGSSAPVRWFGRVLARSLAGQIAISRAVADRVEGRSEIIRSGTADAAGTVRAAGREPVVLVLQRLEREKCTDLALRAWARSGLAAQGWTMQVAGEGSQAGYLKELAAQLGLGSSCRFLGYRSDTTDLYRRASILLAPSPNDGLGLAVVEAMAAALPVVAAAAGGHLETVGALSDSSLFAPGDFEAAGRALARLAVDPSHRDCYGARLQAFQREHLSIERQVLATIDFYRELILG